MVEIKDHNGVINTRVYRANPSSILWVKNKYNFSSEQQTQNSLNSKILVGKDWSINPEAQQHIEMFMRDNKVLWNNEYLND